MTGIVITNLTHLLRMPKGRSPDLVALKLRAKLPLSDEEKAITEPPAYARSWKALLDASTGATPQVNIAADLFARCAANFTSGAYLAWTPTSVANFLEQFAAGNQNSLQWIAGAKATKPAAANAPPPHAAARSQVGIKVRDHIATALGADKSQLGPETDLTKHLQLGERDLHALAGQINRTDWMKSLSSRLDPGDIKGVTTIGGLTNVILSKAAKQNSAGAVATPMQAPPVQRREEPAATLTTILADEKSRFRLADQIGIPRSVLDALAKPSAALPQPGSLAPAVPSERADNIVVVTAALPARPAAALAISPRAFDMIVTLEVTSRQVYDERYHRPVWPSEESGIIIGIGYDLARVSKEQLRLDWQGSLAEETIAALEPAAGAIAQAAKQLAPALAASVDIPWDNALAVHGGKVVPRWIGIVDRALANCRIVPPDCLGALVSLTYNQGDGYAQSGDQFREMRAIRDHMAALRFSAVASEIRAMKRLWPDNPGLTERREREAKLFEDGLAGLSAR
jgi:hypothetical protein